MPQQFSKNILPLARVRISTERQESPSSLNQPQNLLIIGNMLSSGTATEKQLYQISNIRQARDLFGARSILAKQCQAALAAQSGATIYAKGYEDPSAGTQATGTITVSGTAASSGVLVLVGLGNRYEVAVAEDQSASDVASAIAASINQSPSALVTASASGAVVTLTASHSLAMLNGYSLVFVPQETSATGISLAMADLSGGAGAVDYSLETPLSDLENVAVTQIALAESPQALVDYLETQLESRYSENDGRDGLIYYGNYRSLYSTLLAQLNALNSIHRVVLDVFPKELTAWEVAADAAAVSATNAIALRSNADSQSALAISSAADYRSRDERNTLGLAGASVLFSENGIALRYQTLLTLLKIDSDGERLSRPYSVTQFQTLGYMRWRFITSFNSRFGGRKLVQSLEKVGADVLATSPAQLRGAAASLLRDFEMRGLLDNADAVIAGLQVETLNQSTVAINVRVDAANELSSLDISLINLTN